METRLIKIEVQCNLVSLFMQDHETIKCDHIYISPFGAIKYSNATTLMQEHKTIWVWTCWWICSVDSEQVALLFLMPLMVELSEPWSDTPYITLSCDNVEMFFVPQGPQKKCMQLSYHSYKRWVSSTQKRIFEHSAPLQETCMQLSNDF